MDPMLIKSGLFGRGLVTINTPRGVAMFNEALGSLGIEPTDHKSFGIDGVGWSPDIATERGDPHYMGAGATRFGIIATPEQEGKPIHIPMFSFKRRLERQYFDRFKRPIIDTTTSSCVVQEFIYDTLTNDTPKDFVFMDEVLVHSSAGKLVEDVAEQKQLAADFESPGLKWFNKSLRTRIIVSAAEYGDLRRRRCEFPDWKFSLIGDFWARFEGKMVFVLRAGADSILIVEDEAWLPKIQPEKGERYRVFALNERRRIIEYLIDEDLVELDLKAYKNNTDLLAWLEQLENYLIMEAVCSFEPDCDFAEMSKGKRSRILVGRKNDIELLSELQRFKRSLTSKVSGKAIPEVSEGLGLLLLRPNQKLLSQRYQDVLWMLLLRLQESPPDPLLLYKHDKERFFKLFEGWTPAKKQWVSTFVSENYQPEMSAEP